MPVTEIAHVSGLLPLLGLLALRRDAPPAYWLVALGFSVSFFADSVTVLLGGSWALTYVYPALQLGVFGWAFGSRGLVWALLGLTAAQIVFTPLAGPEMIVTVAGSAAVLWLAQTHRLFASMVAYCFAGTALYLLLVLEVWRPQYMTLWYAYQTSRLAAFGLFARAAWRANA
jgi:hypothetical protein